MEVGDKSVQELHARLIKVEIDLEYIKANERLMTSDIREVRTEIRKMASNLVKIQYTVIGAAIWYVAQEFGVISAIKAVLGVVI